MTRRKGIPLPRSLSLACSKGFTLIELAVVVVIISMLLSLGLGALNAQLASAAHGETKKRQALIKDALTAYLGANKRLPCPDHPDFKENGDPDPNKEVTGKEDRVGGVATGACSGGNIGVVPYATLGLSREVALDGWSNFMSYSIPDGDPTCKDTVLPYWSRDDCFGAAKAPELLYSLYGGTATAPKSVAINVLAVVISHGPNGFAAWGRQGNRLNVQGMRCEEAHNAITSICSGQKPDGSDWRPVDFFGGEFTSEVDDVVIALTREEAISRLIMEGALRSAEGKLVEDFARLRSEKLYEKIKVSKDLEGCMSIGPITDFDPWGSEYRIVEGPDTNGRLPVCICSTRGSTATLVPANPPSPCSYTTPTTCVQINASEVNAYRLNDEC